MNPYKLSQVYKQLTSQNSILKKYLKLGTKELKQPDLPAFVETKNAVNRFVRDNPRPDQLGRKDMAGGGMLVKPSADGSRPGYAVSKTDNNKYRVTGERGGVNYSDWARENDVPIRFSNKKEAEAAQKKFYKSVPTSYSITKEAWTNEMTSLTEKFNKMVLKDFEKGNMSKTPKFATWLKSQKLKNAGVKFFETQAPSFGVINVGNKKFELADILINRANDSLKHTEWMDIQKKVSPSKAIDTNTWRSYIDRLDTKPDKANKAFDYLLDNDIELKLPKNLSKTMAAEGSLLRKVISDITGLKSSKAIRAGLNMNDAYNKNIDQIKFANQGNLWTQGEGRTLSEILENADYRMKGNISWTSDIKLSNRANKNVFDYALRNFNYHQLNKTGKGTIQFYDKKTNKPIDWNTLPKNKNGFRVLKPNSVYFIDASMPNKKWDMTSIDADNLKWSKGKGSSGLFDEVFQAKDKYDKLLATKVDDPRNPKKQISFGKLMSEVYQTGFDNFGNPYAIEHADGVANNPFKNLKIASQRVNSALSSLNRDTKLAKSQKNKIFKELQKNVFNPADQNMIDDLIKSTQPLQSDVLVKGQTITGSEIDNLLASISSNPKCQILMRKQKADGGRIGYQSGTVSLSKCAEDGARVINSGMKNANSTQLKNFAAFANRAKNLGRNVMKFGIIPEAMYVAADATIRLAMGDKPIEALLRASNYVLPGDQTKLAEMMEATRLMNPETAAIIGRSIDYKNQLAKIQSLEDTRANLENLSGGGEFDYIGDLNQDVLNLNNQIKQATDALNTKFKMTDAEQIYANRMQDEVDDIRKSKSILTKLKSMFRDTGQDASDVETLGAPEVTQKQLNKRMTPQLDRDLLLATNEEMIQAAKNAQAQGYDIPDDYYIQQQKEAKEFVQNTSLADLAAATSPELIYGASGTMGEPLFKGVVEKPQNIIGDMEREITGQTNVANPFDIDLSMIGTGLRGFSAAGGGIAKEAGDPSGPPPESGPNSQGLSYLMKRGKNI